MHADKRQSHLELETARSEIRLLAPRTLTLSETSKFQAPTSREAPNFNHPITNRAPLGVEVWIIDPASAELEFGVGAWNLPARPIYGPIFFLRLPVASTPLPVS